MSNPGGSGFQPPLPPRPKSDESTNARGASSPLASTANSNNPVNFPSPATEKGSAQRPPIPTQRTGGFSTPVAPSPHSVPRAPRLSTANNTPRTSTTNNAFRNAQQPNTANGATPRPFVQQGTNPSFGSDKSAFSTHNNDHAMSKTYVMSKTTKTIIAIVIVVMIAVAGTLSYGYFVNNGNNPIGEKLGMSRVAVTDQSQSTQNNGSYPNTNDSKDAAEEDNKSDDDDTPQSIDISEIESIENLNKDAKKVDPASVPANGIIAGMLRDWSDTGGVQKSSIFYGYKVIYTEGITAKQFVDRYGSSLKVIGEKTTCPDDSTIRFDGITGAYDTYEQLFNYLYDFYNLLIRMYQSGIDNPQIEISYHMKNGQTFDIPRISMQDEFFPRFTIPGTDPAEWDTAKEDWFQ